MQELPVTDKTLASCVFDKPPNAKVEELLDASDKKVETFKQFLVQNKKMPNSSQLQNFAKSSGNPMKYNEVKPTLEMCRKRLLNAANESHVIVTDAFGADIPGTLLKWEIPKNGGMVLELMNEEQTDRFNCTTTGEPGIILSEFWVKWLQGEQWDDD